MLKFSLKNLLTKVFQSILIIVSIVISSSVAVVSYNVSNQVSDGLTNNALYYSLIIGPSGSQTQLAMNSMYFTDSPLGTIPYSLMDNLLMDSRVREVIPFAMADEYNGAKIVGSNSLYLNNHPLKEGSIFKDDAVFEIVLGYNVAKINDSQIGDLIYTSHSDGDMHHTPFKVVGILDRSYSSFDNVCFTQIQSIWQVHEAEHEEEHEEEHDEMNDMVCAFLVKTMNPVYAIQLQNEYNGKIITAEIEEEEHSFILQAIEPMNIMRSVLEDTDQNKYLIYALSAIILVMNILVISIITVLNMYQSTKDIKLMRLIGISMKKINLVYLIQNAIIGLAAIILAFMLSRIGILALGSYVGKMGVVMNINKVYPLEIVILLAVLIINILPTIICTKILASKDGINNE